VQAAPVEVAEEAAATAKNAFTRTSAGQAGRSNRPPILEG
jgi:hypothetical protein